MLSTFLGTSIMYDVILFVVVSFFITWAVVRRCVFFLGKEEQLRVHLLTETVVKNGPGMTVLNPLGYKSADRTVAAMLGTLDYMIVKDTIEGKERVEKGPKSLFLGPYEVVSTGMQQGATLSEIDYIHVENKLTGEQAIVKGPLVWFPSSPHEQISGGVKTATTLLEDEYLRIKDTATGVRMVKQGKCLLFLEPTWKAEGKVQKAWTLKTFQYIRLQNQVTSKISVHRGEKTVFPGPHDTLLDGDVLDAIDLKVNEYVKVEDKVTGEIRVEKGVSRVFLGATERAIDGGKKDAIKIDEEHAVLVRDQSSGHLRLVTEKQLFVPGPHEAIEKVQELIRLADHEAVIVRGKDGTLSVHYGNPDKVQAEHPRCFFLPPFSEIVKLTWSGGLRRAKRDLVISRFDTRPMYLWNEIDVRTTDNVELRLETTMFWSVLDLKKLVQSTGDFPGDVYNQGRSQFIKHVAKMTLKKFMEELHHISSTIFREDQPFFEARGVCCHSLEVTKYQCVEAGTSEVLQRIIEETTNRLNRLSQAEGENEVNLFRVQGQIEHEKLKGELQEIQQKHSQSEAYSEGLAEADRVAAFVSGLAQKVPKLEKRLEMWQVLRQTDSLEVVSKGGGSFHYTPADVKLAIKAD